MYGEMFVYGALLNVVFQRTKEGFDHNVVVRFNENTRLVAPYSSSKGILFTYMKF